jgi:death-on-curing protein
LRIILPRAVDALAEWPSASIAEEVLFASRKGREAPVFFLSVDEALAIHERPLEAFGGASGVRDPGLVESALFRPQTGYYADLAEMAAALFESLITNPPLVDGNKRVAFFATDVFLRLNGWKLEVEGEGGASLPHRSPVLLR